MQSYIYIYTHTLSAKLDTDTSLEGQGSIWAAGDGDRPRLKQVLAMCHPLSPDVPTCFSKASSSVSCPCLQEADQQKFWRYANSEMEMSLVCGFFSPETQQKQGGFEIDAVKVGDF